MKKSADLRIGDLVIHNDHQLIAFNKPGGMPSQDDTTGDNSLHLLAQAYSKRDLYVINRLDRPCSGLVIFAKTKESASELSSQWQNRSVSKKYLAVIPKGLEPTEGILEHFISKKGNKSIATNEAQSPDSKKASLHYKVIAQLDNYDILELITHSGYYHQIRAQLSAAGYPVKDDVKYGARRSNPNRTIYLHCSEIAFIHPGSHTAMTLTCDPPEEVLWQQLKK